MKCEQIDRIPNREVVGQGQRHLFHEQTIVDRFVIALPIRGWGAEVRRVVGSTKTINFSTIGEREAPRPMNEVRGLVEPNQ